MGIWNFAYFCVLHYGKSIFHDFVIKKKFDRLGKSSYLPYPKIGAREWQMYLQLQNYWTMENVNKI